MVDRGASAGRAGFRGIGTGGIAALAVALLSAAMLAAAGPAAAADPVVLRVNTFPNAKALGLQAGIAKGIFARHGLRVELAFTEGSKAQRDGLAAGTFDIAQGAVDNAVDMIETAKKDVIIVSGGDSGMNEFYVQAGIGSFAELRGHTIVVDAPDTAYALQVKKLMAQHGVPEGDYQIKPIGAGVFRFKAMVEDKSEMGMPPKGSMPTRWRCSDPIRGSASS